MARRGCAFGRRKQLQRLNKALYGHQEFDPPVFDKAASTQAANPPPYAPTYRSYVLPILEGPPQQAAPVPAPKSIFKVPARPATSDVAPMRLPTRPLPVSAQIKRRDGAPARPIILNGSKPCVRVTQHVNFTILKRGNKYIIKGKLPATPP